MIDYRYQVGGSLHNQDISYVEREADAQLYNTLHQGEFCYVLNSRQMGKSSLLVRTKHRLEERGFCCSAIDLTGIGSEYINPEQWYRGIISQLYLGFNLVGKVNLKSWWSEQTNITLVQRLNHFILDILLVEFKNQELVIFIDEIDSIFSLPFSSDDFFAFIRFCYNQRAIATEYQRINFAIFGVATPSSLICDKQRTPFNIGQAIQLTGFSLDKSLSLAQGLNLPPDTGKLVFQDILRWTSGQPFLTQKLCRLIAENIQVINSQEVLLQDNFVNKIVQRQIIDNWESQDDPEHLRTIRDRILNSKETSVRVLGIYQEILLTNQVARDDSPEQIELLLSGLVIDKKGYLQVKNLIYQTIFNLEWIADQLKSLRPYSLPLKKWLDSHKQDKTQLLQNISLEQALIWAKEKKLADIDYQFLGASQELAKQQAQQQLNLEQIARKKIELALEAATEANNILAEVKQTIRRKNKNFRLSKILLLVIIIATTGFIILFRLTGWLQFSEFAIFDRFMQIRPIQTTEERIVIIGIDELDIQNIGEYPISDRILAQAISQLQSYQPSVIGLDIYRDLPVEPGTEELEIIFVNNSNLLGIEKIINSKVNPPKTLAKLNQVGFNDLVLDKDGKVRRALLSYDAGEDAIKYSFALRLALKYLEKYQIKPETVPDNIHQIKLGKAIFNPLKDNDGSYIRAKTGGYQIMLNYDRNQAEFTTYSLTDLLAKKIPESAIADHVVIIGVTAPSINDFFATPYSSQQLMPGVVIHGNIISQILQAALSGKGLFKVLPESVEWLGIVFWSFFGSILAWTIKSKLKLLVAVLSAILALTIISYQLFLWQWWLPVVPCFLALIIAVFLTLFITAQKQDQIQVRQTIELLLAICQDQPAAGRIAIEYFKQGESEENVITIEQIISKKTISD
ncbi:MAG: CHASE2 domain-containing protein [Cyanobacteria bacterium P01_F01_bin.143]